MGALLVLALVVVPLVEIFLLIQVGQVLGAVPTIMLLLVMSVLGGLLLRREGARAWRAFRGALQSGRIPAREVADGALVIFGGALLLTPGFFTDAVGLLCVLPLTRPALRAALTRVVTARLGLVGMAGSAAASHHGRRRPAPGGGPVPGQGSGRVVEGEVVDPPDGEERPPAG